MITSIAFSLLTCLGPWTVTPTPTAELERGVEIGDVPRYTFQRPLLNGMGVASLEDLRGRPLFIQFWGHQAAALSETMREVLVWQEAYGEDLSVLFVEVKQASDLLVTSLALNQKWLGGRALWTTELPCRTGIQGALPQFVLLSNEGVVLLKGTTERFELGYRDDLVEEIEDILRKEVERRRRGPADHPADLARAWEAFAEGRIEEAGELARSLTDGVQGDESSMAAATETLAVFRARIERRLQRTAWQIENGYLLQAEEELTRLAGQLDGVASLAARRAELSAALHDESLQPEWKAAKDLAKLEKKLYAKGSKSVLVKQLARLARKHSGTRSAERAAQLFEAARVSPYK